MAEELREGLERVYILLDKLYASVSRVYSAVLSLSNENVNRKGVHHYVNEATELCEELKNQVTREAVLFIARFQPLGEELLAAENAIKASYDLYRITRYLREIVHLDKKIGPLYSLLKEEDWRLLELTRDMLVKTYDFFRRGEGDPLEIAGIDDEIDSAYEEILTVLASKEVVPKHDAVRALYRRHVERIADHIIYMLTRIPWQQ